MPKPDALLADRQDRDPRVDVAEDHDAEHRGPPDGPREDGVLEEPQGSVDDRERRRRSPDRAHRAERRGRVALDERTCAGNEVLEEPERADPAAERAPREERQDQHRDGEHHVRRMHVGHERAGGEEGDDRLDAAERADRLGAGRPSRPRRQRPPDRRRPRRCTAPRRPARHGGTPARHGARPCPAADASWQPRPGRATAACRGSQGADGSRRAPGLGVARRSGSGDVPPTLAAGVERPWRGDGDRPHRPWGLRERGADRGWRPCAARPAGVVVPVPPEPSRSPRRVHERSMDGVDDDAHHPTPRSGDLSHRRARPHRGISA